jgi:hypothetical protein
MNSIQIPSAREVYFLISTNEDFVEKMLLEMYRRHEANKNKSNPACTGKGFNHVTRKDGLRLGRWLDRHGHFTSGVNSTGEANRSRKSRDQHIQKARDVLYRHVDQIISIITEKVQARRALNRQQRMVPSRAPAAPAVMAQMHQMHQNQIMSILTSPASQTNPEENPDLELEFESAPDTIPGPSFIPDDERITEPDLNAKPWMVTPGQIGNTQVQVLRRRTA